MTTQKPRDGGNAFKKRNDAVRLDFMETLDPLPRVSVEAFFRRLGMAHIVGELISPMMELTKARLWAGFRDRPWPPWGLGAQRIHALCMVHSVGQESYAISPVFTDPEDTTNVGLIAALYKEVLDDICQPSSVDVNYGVIEGSVLAARVLKANGFEPTEDVLLTENARYVIYRADGARLRKELGLDDVSSPELLAYDFGNDVLDRIAAFHSTVYLSTAASLVERAMRPEMTLIDMGRFGAALPGGVLS
jgi:hypothetical protein